MISIACKLQLRKKHNLVNENLKKKIKEKKTTPHRLNEI